MKKFFLVLTLCSVTAFGNGCSDDDPIAVSGISLNKTTLALERGQSEKLTATVTPSDAEYDGIEWQTSDASVATVDKGIVTAVAAGSATISASAGGQTAACTVTVNVPVTGISLDKTTLTLDRGQSEKLTVTVTPADAQYDDVVWETSDASVATVDKGTVTAAAAGSATISAKIGEQTATCTVTVSVPVTGISLDKTTLELNVGQTQQLQATITPSDATDPSVKWSTSNKAAATVTDNGTVEAVAPGETTITATSANGLTAKCTVTVKQAAKVWSVGDLYDVEGVKGVVVEVSNGGANGKIISMDEAVKLWASGTISIGCDSETDGKANTQKAKDYNSNLSAFPDSNGA
ncbi:MAG: Ig-like domain-containing protein [Alistipes sp.]|nr:Ig-like domain-containing protein [Alistipes sp.]